MPLVTQDLEICAAMAESNVSLLRKALLDKVKETMKRPKDVATLEELKLIQARLKK